MATAKNTQVSVVQESMGLSGSGISIGDFLRRYTWLILTCATIGVVASFIYWKLQKPVYEATAVIRIDPGRASSLGLGDLFSGPTSEQNDTIHTEIAIIKSDAVTIETLNSLSAEDFERFTHTPREKPIPYDQQVLPTSDEALISKTQASTTVRQEEGTQLLDIRFKDGDPQVAAMMANKIVEAYTLQSFKSREKSVEQLRSYLLERMNTLRTNLGISQTKLADFQQKNQILGPSNQKNTITDRLTELSTLLTGAQAKRIALEAQANAARSGDATALATLFPNPGLTRLQNDEGNAEAEAAQMSTKFGPNYPPLAQKRKQIEVLKAEILSGVQSVKAQLKQEYDAAHNNEMMLQRQYDEQKMLAYGLNRSQAEYVTLQEQVGSTQQLYDMLQRKLQQAEVDTEVGSISTVLIDDARAPTSSVEVKKSIILIAGLLIGIFAGGIAAFGFDLTSGLVRTSDNVQSVVGTSPLAVVPRNIVKADGHLAALQSPQSASAEAYRGFRNLLTPGLPSEGNAILFVSATADEGLNDAAANFAVSLAQTGIRVLLVDADLRQPHLHELFGIPNGSGLGDFLSGSNLSVSSPVKSLPSLTLLTAGAFPSFPSEVLSSPKMKSALESWKSSYDYVVWLTAPLLSVSDGMLLTKWSDKTVLVTRYGVSNMRALGSVHKLLRQIGANVVGFVILDVPKSSGTFTGKITNPETRYA